MMCTAAEECLEGVVISLHRAMRQLRVNAMAWASAKMKGIIAHANFIAKLKWNIARLCKKQNQKNKQIIEHLLKETVV